jgi:hypothetical protein
MDIYTSTYMKEIPTAIAINCVYDIMDGIDGRSVCMYINSKIYMYIYL